MARAPGRRWERGEIARALDLYIRTPFGRLHSRNPEVAALAEALGRTPGSVALKLVNLAALDPTLARAGMGNASRLDGEVWRDFFSDPEAVLAEAAAEAGARAAGFAEAPASALRPPGGEGRDAPAAGATRRVGQDRFRVAVLTAYGGRCAVTGLDDARLLTASHIEPWAEAAGRRLDPSNGLCLNALHDRAFDRGLIVVEDDLRVRVSPRMAPEARRWFERAEHGRLRAPERFLPSPERLAAHRARWAANFG